MKTWRLTYPLTHQADGERVLALGFFDGVHIGHQQVIGKAVELGKKMGLPAGVMTFDPHPREVLGKKGYSRYITPLNEKLRRLEQLGLDFAYVLSFTREFASLPPEEFIRTYLLGLKVKGVSVGFDFTFGHRGLGTPETLREWAPGRFELEVVSPVETEGEKVSSTNLRQLIAEGRMGEVTALLGRPYAIQGEVVHGDKRGRTIGFPTANLMPEEPYLIPRTGVYIVRCEVEGQHWWGACNVGYNPTFEDDLPEPRIEIYLLDFSGDLYGKRLRASFLHFIRPEYKFSTVEELVERMNQDVEETRHWIAAQQD